MSTSEKVRCAATTKAGKPCKNYAVPGSAYCHIHQKWQEKAAVETGPKEPEKETAVSSATNSRQALAAELDELVTELRRAIPSARSTLSPYTPLIFLTYMRDNISKMTPDMQLNILESFEGMTAEDLKDVDTWKGMMYMASYSAKFRANQVKEKMNEQLPEPFQPDSMLEYVKKHVDRFTPEVVKGIIETFQGATKEDLLDLETWKGIWYMLNYSLQFQTHQLKERLLGEGESEEEAG